MESHGASHARGPVLQVMRRAPLCHAQQAAVLAWLNSWEMTCWKRSTTMGLGGGGPCCWHTMGGRVSTEVISPPLPAAHSARRVAAPCTAQGMSGGSFAAHRCAGRCLSQSAAGWPGRQRLDQARPACLVHCGTCRSLGAAWSLHAAGWLGDASLCWAALEPADAFSRPASILSPRARWGLLQGCRGAAMSTCRVELGDSDHTACWVRFAA